ncbi:serine/threonine-protein kinase [Streptomyces caniscabiei]|uniref:serine/threonine-protein kinase n=1 Tax=Streptomyces caniscabiei TaxID=2746961 RepID=UPI0029BA0855|nr:serine/threonine-protein kinase [Streptomyces caniscabiei]MDX2603822.1 serine/threonine-protein kinase [Streptomyces caniscabiei]MDX2738646.1 serine/threonine-protein kinase [Streptomyces caniscabiei]MDX2777818.1 serine/threonine-protein kinase [Streptomyces caniscabiei]
MPLRDDDPTVIGGYALEDRLGSGGMGVVYRARSASGRLVAIKLVHAQYRDDEEFRSRFRQEIAAVRRVSGAFTAAVVDADPEAARPWMATQYVPGPTLFDLVREEGPLDGERIRSLALGLVEALRDIHRAGVVHRDLKPANVLMAEDGPRVIDFGISRAGDNLPLTVTGRVIGTPPFMSPEQLRSPRDVTAASDVFSLGSLLVYAASGHSPFKAESPYLAGYQVMFEAPKLDAVPEPLRTIAERCLDKNPTTRPDLTELHGLFLRSATSPTSGLRSTPTPDRPDPDRTDAGRADDTTENDRLPDVRSVDGGPPGRPAVGRPARERRPRLRAGRRLLLVGLGAALTVSALSAALLLPTGAEDGTTASGTGAAVDRRSASLPEGWRPWQTRLRADSGLPADRIPVNYDDTGCRTDGTDLYCGGTGFLVGKVDAATGATGWRYGQLPQTARPIGVRDGLVLVYTEPDSTQRRLVALDTRTGKQRWSRPISASEAAPLFDGGVLSLAPDHYDVIAYDMAGKELWRTSEPAGINCVPSVLGDDPYELCWEGDDFLDTRPFTLVRLDPDDGTPRARSPLPEKSLALGVVDGRPLFLKAESTEEVYQAGYERPYDAFLRVDPDTGKVTRIPLKRALRGAATLVDGVVYFVRTSGSVTAVSAASGTVLWERTTDMENLSAPVVSAARDEIYFANRFGRLLALDSRTGAEVWRTDALDDPGDIATETPPRVLLVDDAIVATAGNMAFSVNPDEPMETGATVSTFDD